MDARRSVTLLVGVPFRNRRNEPIDKPESINSFYFSALGVGVPFRPTRSRKGTRARASGASQRRLRHRRSSGPGDLSSAAAPRSIWTRTRIRLQNFFRRMFVGTRDNGAAKTRSCFNGRLWCVLITFDELQRRFSESQISNSGRWHTCCAWRQYDQTKAEG